MVGSKDLSSKSSCGRSLFGVPKERRAHSAASSTSAKDGVRGRFIEVVVSNMRLVFYKGSASVSGSVGGPGLQSAAPCS